MRLNSNHNESKHYCAQYYMQNIIFICSECWSFSLVEDLSRHLEKGSVMFSDPESDSSNTSGPGNMYW